VAIFPGALVSVAGVAENTGVGIVVVWGIPNMFVDGAGEPDPDMFANGFWADGAAVGTPKVNPLVPACLKREEDWKAICLVVVVALY